MEELFKELNIKFTAYNWHKGFLRPNGEKDIAEEIKQEIIEILSHPLDCQVKPATCGNCKHYDQHTRHIFAQCKNPKLSEQIFLDEYSTIDFINPDFGCVNFESKLSV